MAEIKKTPVQFQMERGDLATVRVTAVDGQKYLLKLGVVVFEVIQVEGDGVVGPTKDTPAFELRANLVTDTIKEA